MKPTPLKLIALSAVALAGLGSGAAQAQERAASQAGIGAGPAVNWEFPPGVRGEPNASSARRRLADAEHRQRQRRLERRPHRERQRTRPRFNQRRAFNIRSGQASRPGRPSATRPAGRR